MKKVYDPYYGALGHIGSALIRALPKYINCHKIILLDNLATSRYPSLFNLPKGVNYVFRECDVRDDFSSLVNDSVDIVIHLAALTEPKLSQEKPDEFIQYNEKATSSVLRFTKEKSAKLIAISSTSIYSKSGKSLDENVDKSFTSGQTPYAKCKLVEERMIFQYNSSIAPIILRFGTIYGTSIGMRFHTAVNKFCWEAVFKGHIPIWETALNQLRPYLALEDAVQAIIHSVINKDMNGGIYNVVSNNSTVNDIVSIIQEYKPSVEVSLVKSDIMNDLSYSVSCHKLCSTGFYPTGSMRYSIHETMKILGGI